MFGGYRRKYLKRLFFFFLVCSPLSIVHSPEALAAISFTGNVTQDFKSDSCISDPGGQDVGMPSAYSAGTISGFDIKKVCLSYDPTNDTLYVGIQTFVDASNQNIIFGDADGDGDASSSSIVLRSLLGVDQPNLSGQEFFTMALDFNGDQAPDLVVGTHNENSLNEFAAVGGVAAPDNNLLLAGLKRFYGTAIAGVSATLDHLPTHDKPHLEFSVAGLSKVPGYSSLNFNNPDSFFQLYITTGSFDDDGIAEEYFPNTASTLHLKADMLKDSDGDTINDAQDKDNDNDGIPDLVEKNLSQYDTDGDGVLSAAEVTASGKDTNGDGDIDTNDGIVWPDTDGDGTPDTLDTDSDNDGILDKFEGVSNYRTLDSDGDGLADNVEDANRNGKVDPGETDPKKYDTDGDGLCDGTVVVGSCTGLERDYGTDPTKVDTDGDGLCDGSIVVSPCFNSEGNLKTNPLIANLTTTDNGTTVSPPLSLPPSSANSPATALDETRLGGDVDLTKGPVRLQGQGCSMIPGVSNFGMFFWWIFLTLWFGIVPKVWAVRADHYQNSMDGLGTLNIESAKTLPKKEFSLGLSTHLMQDPLGFGLTSTGRSLDNVVSFFWVYDFWGAYALYDNFEIGAHIPISLFSQIEDLTSTVERNTTSMGDIQLMTKWKVMEGLSLISFLGLPTGEEGDFFGEKNVTGGVKGVASHLLGRHEVSLNLGVFARGKEMVTASNIDLLDIGPEMSWGGSWCYLMNDIHQWYLMSSLWGRSDFASEATSPMEWDFAFQKRSVHKPLEATLGIGFGLDKGYGVPTYRIIGGVAWVPGRGRTGEKRTMDHGLGTMSKQQEKRGEATITEKQIVVLQPIPFETNRATLKQEAFPILDDVAHLLEQNPTIQKIRIEGHTDSDGSDRFNLKLSQARAEAVRETLVKKGISRNRLTSKGWGESHPIVPNISAGNKAQNRRVEFHIVEVEK